uniref:Uncharacterized protein n=1 Tax=Nelumbo nucifera TaxID=4432 RepID=A0A822YEB5_NELNU|nr:TPA_asm: hypothetical protein HUJ06_009593 [Nelumbo nucifera]
MQSIKKKWRRLIEMSQMTLSALIRLMLQSNKKVTEAH